MKNKPVVTDSFTTTHTSFELVFDFDYNLTVLMGDSGTGKTASFSFIQECMAVDSRVKCYNYLNIQSDILADIKALTGKLIVIDNADILLDDETRKYIALDDKNQYLIIGRNPANLFTTKENLYELVSEKAGEKTILRIEPYL